MSWRKFKENNVYLNYTVMLLPHSKKKPIHFNMPVWVFGAVFLFIMSLVGGILFFAGANHQLRQVEVEKMQIEQEWQKISEQKQQIENENEDLKLAREQQEKELEQLEKKTVDTITELKKLTSRENEIRSQIGLDTVDIEDLDEALLDDTSVQMSMNDGDVNIVQKNLDMLRAGMSEQYLNYDALTGRIADFKKEQFRQDVVDYALQFVGNAYVYGGTNPNTGADCSGFTRYVMSHAAGVSLTRTAAQQARTGPGISESEVRPGDLVFYGSGSFVNHVAIYIGDGKIVHASNERTGIKVSGWKYRTPVKIVNVIGD